MSEVSELSEIGHRAHQLLDLLDDVHLSPLDFDNREHLQVIELCLDMAIEHVEKLK